MKRYLCEKKVWIQPDPIYPEGGRLLAFKAGNIYAEHVNDYWSELTDELGTAHIVTKELLVDFKELPPIDDVPNDEAYADQDDMDGKFDMGMRGISTGCAMVIAFFITLGIIAYKIFV